MQERIRCTMRDVARLAGVSISTVSAVINETVQVSADREKRVRTAMQALDYHPDQVARSLKVGKTNVIGVIVPDITNTFYPEVIRGAEAAAAVAGYGVLLCDSNENAAEEQKHLAMLSARRVDGVLLACCANSSAYDTLIRRRFPIVFVDRIPDSAVEGTVCTDNLEAGYMATRHLIALGHERIGLLAGHRGLSPHRDRLEGFRKAMQESHLLVRDEYLVCGGIEIKTGYESGKAMMTLPNPPTAILASNNMLTLGLIKAIRELEIPCPLQVSVIGFDDYVWNECFSPSVTTVAQPGYEAGRRSFEMLLQVIKQRQDEKPQDRNVRLRAELRVRDSTGPPERPAGQNTDWVNGKDRGSDHVVSDTR